MDASAHQYPIHVVLLPTTCYAPVSLYHRRCPDCEAADPVIEEALHGTSGVLLRCYVRRSEYKNNPDYFYRSHKKVKLQAIPTLMRWGRTGPVASLVEGQLENRESVKDLVRS